MTTISGDWLRRSETQRVFEAMRIAGHQAYVVGGCVRNTILGEPVSDVDFATDATPEQVVDIAKQSDIRAVPTGVEHGTVTLVLENQTYEMTTYRRDVDTDGRHARVIFADNITEDAHRRDFTMNAIYADHLGHITDPLNGLADLRERRIRFIDDPYQRIREDYLRILRFFRFHAWFGDPGQGLDADALAACAELADGILRLSKERVGAEMLKLLRAPDPAPSVSSMEISGILNRVLPGASSRSMAPLVHQEQIINIAPDPIRRLAAMGGEDQNENLRLSRKQARQLRLYLTQLNSEASIQELAYRNGRDPAIDIAVLRATVTGENLPDDILFRIEYSARQVFPVAAADITTGESGPELGARLQHLETKWIQSNFAMTKEQLLTYYL